MIDTSTLKRTIKVLRESILGELSLKNELLYIYQSRFRANQFKDKFLCQLLCHLLVLHAVMQ